MLPDQEEVKLKDFLLTGGGTQNGASPDDPTNFSMATTSDSSTVWTTIPQIAPANEKDATTAEIVTISEAYGQQNSSTTSLSSSVSSQYQYNTYPTSAQYAMYTSATPATAYYQQMASNLRAQTSAAFPYSLAGTSSYYTGSYPVDYTAAAAYPSPYYTNIRGGAPYYNPLNAAAYATVANSVLGSDAVTLGGSGGSADTSTPATSSSIAGTFQSLKEKKQKAKKKKTGSCSPGDETYARVFIWDLEDIAVLTRNYLQSITMGFPGYANAAGSMQHLTERIALSSFTDISEVMEGDVTNIEDAVVDESTLETGGPMDNLRGLDVMRRVAPKYSSFRQFYTELSRKMHSGGSSQFKQEAPTMLNFELLNALGLAAREVELSQAAIQLQGISDIAQRWQCAARCMDLVQKRSDESREEKYANVVLAGDGVVLGAAQLMIAGLSPSVPIENIYSVSKTGKEAIFEKIQTRYGKKCSFVCVTGTDTAVTAKRLSIPVWPVQSFNDLDKLFNAQTNYLLG